ncbi:hypothetical protein A4R40_12045 [Photorhabdus laumondii subsp. laumondii]|nr:hypothetical protein A4R40_12045 [Photorhabdus laumondii subsp. laumondii]
MFPYYSLELGILYAAVDGQKFSVEYPMIKAHGSKKYLGRGKGVVAYTLLCNHIDSMSTTQALPWNVGTCRPDVKGAASSRKPASA